MRSCIDFKSISTSISIICLLFLFAGCGDSRNLTTVSGIVKAKGEAVSEGQIMFYPDGGGRPATSQIGSDGRYELTSYKAGDGVAPGSHKVTIFVQKTFLPKGMKEVNSVEEEMGPAWAREKVKWVIPKKYSAVHSTSLTAEVEAGKAMEINFDSADFE